MALNHFDSFYSKVYDKQWQSIRLGLLSPNKYAAVLNNYNEDEQNSIQVMLRQQGAYSLKRVYEKNRKRLANHIEKKQILKQKFSDNEPKLDVDSSHTELDNYSTSEESDYERISSFFTDTDDLVESIDGEPFVNQAQFSIDFNDFVPVSELKIDDEDRNNDQDYFSFYDSNFQVPVTIEDQTELNLEATNLDVWTFPRLDFSQFEPAKLNNRNLFNYYLLDGASVLPVLALDVRDGDYVADLCSAPGGKSLMIYLSCNVSRLLCNDMSTSRLKRLQNVFTSFVRETNLDQKIVMTNRDASTLLDSTILYDKVLVDAPCTNDRHSLYENDNNMFSPKRTDERVRMPTRQLELLFSAMNMVKVGGTVVYSTCSLSPVQNDGVVHMALKRVNDQQLMQFDVVNMKQALRPLRSVFTFDHRFRYGTQVLPNICSNFGPMYISKLVRKH